MFFCLSALISGRGGQSSHPQEDSTLHEVMLTTHSTPVGTTSRGASQTNTQTPPPGLGTRAIDHLHT
ncbi:hypothetical protein PGT21_014987 [Puccinia graminis f. sp. tritici]|uniref:Uncharacterized protein n=1 Tax=Puccinia graminis f. sp. tritici TaxID=56615 RepID=A0A5B0NCC9_PUCGR|nr:hypothetical protein PGT21_014987 [Puccinia graminis f. sp. tritici]